MEIRIQKIDETKNEYIEIGCHRTDGRVQVIESCFLCIYHFLMKHINVKW